MQYTAVAEYVVPSLFAVVNIVYAGYGGLVYEQRVRAGRFLDQSRIRGIVPEPVLD